ncbi:uncharacterized protein LOC129975710 isoform X2 [Argiope bruennichi]|uniref:uncharacterized protein LOC129975710 isoform X2 n=1 Tax=Argiope bruennichi TaxID=94029 RepID=UPI002495217D|nr:uncharacterized protein LOC129975710 isoform X2 [Argiope bruennichi]
MEPQETMPESQDVLNTESILGASTPHMPRGDCEMGGRKRKNAELLAATDSLDAGKGFSEEKLDAFGRFIARSLKNLNRELTCLAIMELHTVINRYKLKNLQLKPVVEHQSGKTVCQI